jgi:predicted nucleotide-binding protein (sugar kinase/HSP70/actin superfamily)
VDEAKLLVAIESAKNIDELIVVFDAINEIRNAKQKVSLMGAYKIRFKELGPEATE